VLRLRDSETSKEMTIRVMREELQALQVKLIESQEQLTRASHQYEEVLRRWLLAKTNETEKLAVELESETMRTRVTPAGPSSDAATAASGPSMVGEASGLSGRPGLDVGAIPKTSKRVLSQAHRGEIYHLCYNLGGTMLVSCSNDKTVKIWDPIAGVSTATLKGSVQAVTRVDIAPFDEFILGASNDHVTRVWSLSRVGVVDPIHTLSGHMAKVMGARFTNDSRRVITGSYDRTIKIWNLERGYCTATIYAFAQCSDLALNADATIIASGHTDNSLRLWDARTRDSVHAFTSAHTRPLTGVAFSPDSLMIASLARDNTIKIVDTRKFDVLTTFRDLGFHVGLNWTNLAWSYDSANVVAGTQEGHIWVWNLTGRKIIRRLTGAHQKPVAACAWSPTGAQIASCDPDGIIVLWE
jgi:autophagy-related protein 16